MKHQYRKNLMSNVHMLRLNQTRQEKHLWYDFLSKYPLRFQRQRPIDNFIVDFYCAKAHLVVELDGGQHNTPDPNSYDDRRTKILQDLGLEVLRFWNMDIDNHFSGVCEAIDRKVKERTSISASPISPKEKSEENHNCHA